MSMLFLILAKMTLSKGHFSNKKSQTVVFKIIGPVFPLYWTFTQNLDANNGYKLCMDGLI